MIYIFFVPLFDFIFYLFFIFFQVISWVFLKTSLAGIFNTDTPYLANVLLMNYENQNSERFLII